MKLSEIFNFGSSTKSQELPVIYPMPIIQSDFIETDVVNIYAKILTDVVERTEGLKDENLNSLWDNCLKSNNSEGLITMLSKAMAKKVDLFLVWDPSLKLLLRATQEQQTQIKADYEKKGESAIGTYISFKEYKRTDMVKLYSALEYCTIGALHKSMNLSNAIQLKVSDLRGSVALNDSAIAEAQAVKMAEGLADGRSVLMDAKDIIATVKPELEAVKSSMEFINERRSFYLAMPASYITGQMPGGLGDSGQGDAKAVERGLKNYYFSIIKPVLEDIFDISTTFKSEDFLQIDSALNTIKTFELVSEELITTENKIIIINKMLGLPPDTKGGEPKPEPQIVMAPGQPNPANKDPKSPDATK